MCYAYSVFCNSGPPPRDIVNLQCVCATQLRSGKCNTLVVSEQLPAVLTSLPHCLQHSKVKQLCNSNKLEIMVRKTLCLPEQRDCPNTCYTSPNSSKEHAKLSDQVNSITDLNNIEAVHLFTHTSSIIV